MKNYHDKPYDRGHAAFLMGETIDRRAVLEMGEEGHEKEGWAEPLGAPLYITLRLDVRLDFYEGAETIERVVNGQSAGITPLYQPGNVMRDGSENLNPLCKVRAVNFVYQGRGLYLDDHERARPFYEGHGLEGLIQLTPGQEVFQKPFAGRTTSLRLETQGKRHDRDEWTEVAGFGRETYPLYPYGGYAPPQGELHEMEQVYAFPGIDRSEGHPVTALKLYRSSFFHISGGFPPTPFAHDHKNWVFPQGVSALEQMTMGQALCEGHLTFTLKDETGDVYPYVSYGYDQPGGSMKSVQVQCRRE